jgi:hypothetical protein
MKSVRLIALVIAVLMMCLMIPSCAEVVTYEDVRFAAIYQIPKVEEVKKDDGTIDKKVTFEEEVLVDVISADITGSSDGTTTVLDAVVQILESNNIKHKVEESSITSIKSQKERSSQGYLYVWEYLINGEKPEGRASEIAVQPGMKIIYILTGGVDKSIQPAETEAE